MQLTVVPDVVYHEVEAKGISIYKNLVVHILEFVSAREHGLKGAALYVAKCRSPNAEIIFATDVQFYYFFNGLDLTDPFLLLIPRFLLLRKLLLLRIHSTDLCANLIQNLNLRFLYGLNLSL